MLKKFALLFVMLILGTVVLLQGRAAIQAADLRHDATPTSAPETDTEPTLADLLARVDQLEARVAELEEAERLSPVAAAGQPYNVTVAIYLLDTADLHDLDVRLNEDGEIMPSDPGQVRRIARLLGVVDWPHALADDAETLIAVMEDLAAALGDDDLEIAAPLATEVHERQHDLSHAAEHWLAGVMGRGGGHHDSADSHADGDDNSDGHDGGSGGQILLKCDA